MQIIIHQRWSLKTFECS